MLPKTPDINLNTDVNFQNYPTNTFYVDPVSKQIRGFQDGNIAMKQAVEIILLVERYKFQIYTPNSGVEFEGLIGNSYGYVISELQRRINDAFIPDNRITGTSDFQFAMADNDSITASFVVNTVYGSFQMEMSVTG